MYEPTFLGHADKQMRGRWRVVSVRESFKCVPSWLLAHCGHVLEVKAEGVLSINKMFKFT